MSWYTNKKAVYEWAAADDGLRQFCPPREYPALWEAVQKKRVGRVPVAMLKILCERRMRSESPALTNAVSKRDLADCIRCSSNSIADAVNRINELVVNGARDGSWAKQYGLVWRNQYGVGIHPALQDLNLAREMSRVQTETVTATWQQNTQIADDCERRDGAEQADIARLRSLSPDARRRLLAIVESESSVQQP